MWCYIKGVQPPKHKQTSEEKRERDLLYEKCQKNKDFLAAGKKADPGYVLKLLQVEKKLCTVTSVLKPAFQLIKQHL